MKQFKNQLLVIAIVTTMLILIVACDVSENVFTENQTNQYLISQNQPTESTTTFYEELSIWDFDDLLYRQPIYISSHGNGFREVWASGHRRFIDTLIFNNTDENLSISSISLAFVSWDWTGAPLSGDLSARLGSSHINKSVFTNIEIPARGYFQFNQSFVASQGLGFGHVSLVDDFDIFDTMAIVVSIRDNNNNEWHNPYFNVFLESFNGINFDEVIIRVAR